MTNFEIIWVGKKARRGPEQELAQRYLSRLSRMLRLNEVVIKPLSHEGMLQNVTRAKEGQRILSKMHDHDYLVLLDERGRSLTSQQLAKLVDRLLIGSYNRVIWLIGGAMGVDDKVRSRANDVINLSAMTLPHALARVLLLEQLYRAMCIRARHPYHH